MRNLRISGKQICQLMVPFRVDGHIYIVRALINVPNFEINLRGRNKCSRLGALPICNTASVAQYILISLYLYVVYVT